MVLSGVSLERARALFRLLGEAADAPFPGLLLKRGHIHGGLLGRPALLRADECTANRLLQFEDGPNVFELAQSFGQYDESVLPREESAFERSHDVPEYAGAVAALLEVEDGLNLL